MALPPDPQAAPVALPARAHHPLHAPWVLRLIAVGKLVKASLFLIAGIAVSSLARSTEVEVRLEQWLGWIHADPNGHFLRKAISFVSGRTPHELKLVGAASFFYAALYSVEGFGLWLDRPWAEWLTVVGTFLLVPIEVYELVENPGLAPVVALVINLVVVAYLIMRLRTRPQRLAAVATPAPRVGP